MASSPPSAAEYGAAAVTARDISKREKLLSFVNFPDVPLRVGRDKRDEARRTLSAAEPVGPSAKRQAERAARADTFGLIAEEWLQMKRKVLSGGTWERDHCQLTKVVGPYLGNCPIASIEATRLWGALRSNSAMHSARGAFLGGGH